jgi:hypothetical protein
MKKALTNEALKNELWDTLLQVKAIKINTIVSNAVAKQSREIMHVIRTEILAASAGKKKTKR